MGFAAGMYLTLLQPLKRKADSNIGVKILEGESYLGKLLKKALNKKWSEKSNCFDQTQRLRKVAPHLMASCVHSLELVSQ